MKSSILRNMTSNLIGSVLVTAITLIVTPLQINILGLEAYGIIGLIVTLQIALTAFDLGLSSTVTREIAADLSSEKHASEPLIRTAFTFYWSMALALAVGLTLSADNLAGRWFNALDLDQEQVASGLQVIALFLALRWPVAFYTGLLNGIQRMDLANVVKVGMLSLRFFGSVVVLLKWRTLDAFLWWTVLAASIEVITYDLVCRHNIPAISFRPAFSIPTIRRVWHFSATMNGLGILAILFTQVDKLVISTTLSLDKLGIYFLAYTSASLIALVITAISTAVLPWFTQAHVDGNLYKLQSNFWHASWMMLFITGLPAGALVFYGDVLLSLWVGKEPAQPATLPAAILAIGFWVSAVVSNCFNVVVAQGKPRRPLIVAALGVLPYMLATYLLVTWIGLFGAALAWLLLQVSNAILLVPHIMRQSLDLPVWPWLTRIIATLGSLTLLAFGVPRLVLNFFAESSPLLQLPVLGFAIILYLFVGYTLAPAVLRKRFLNFNRSLS